MGLDFMLDSLWDDIDSYVKPFDFHSELQSVARHCVEGTFMQDEWQGLLSSLLYHWKAEIKMNLYEAVDYMADVCRYATIGRGHFFSDSYGFGLSCQTNIRIWV